MFYTEAFQHVIKSILHVSFIMLCLLSLRLSSYYNRYLPVLNNFCMCFTLKPFNIFPNDCLCHKLGSDAFLCWWDSPLWRWAPFSLPQNDPPSPDSSAQHTSYQRRKQKLLSISGHKMNLKEESYRCCIEDPRICKKVIGKSIFSPSDFFPMTKFTTLFLRDQPRTISRNINFTGWNLAKWLQRLAVNA